MQLESDSDSIVVSQTVMKLKSFNPINQQTYDFLKNEEYKQDDDGIGEVSTTGGMCMGLTTFGGLEVWAGPLVEGKVRNHHIIQGHF